MSQRIALVGSTKRLILSSGQAMRMPVYGHNFTKMRIGLRLSFPTAITISGIPSLVVGVCSGVSGFADASTTNFVGARSTVTTWPIGGTPGTNAYVSGLSAMFKACTRVNTTLTDGTNIGSSVTAFSAEELVRSALIVQIEKGSPNYSVRICCPTTPAAAQTDISDLQLVQFMEQDDAMTSPGSIVTGYNTLAAGTVAASELAGDLDHIYIFWDKVSVSCYIDDVDHKLVAA